MGYNRVMPRDLFNEANLLKCFGQLYLQLEFHNLPSARLVQYDGPFLVEMDSSDGSLYFETVELVVREQTVPLSRPMNSREPWPLILHHDEGDVIVFNDDGTFTADMLDFLKGPNP